GEASRLQTIAFRDLVLIAERLEVNGSPLHVLLQRLIVTVVSPQSQQCTGNHSRDDPSRHGPLLVKNTSCVISLAPARARTCQSRHANVAGELSRLDTG